MKLIEQTAEIRQQPEGEIGIYRQVEKVARLCYKSEDKITDDSYKKFIEMISSKHHYSPFEHGTVYLKVPLSFNWTPFIVSDDLRVKWYSNNPYSWVSIPDNDTHTAYITTNYRVIKENGLEGDLEFLCEPTEYHERRISVHITTSRAISHELVRHRAFSFCQESQRYCNYSKDKFDNEITFIIPNWCNVKPYEYSNILQVIRDTPKEGYTLGAKKYLETLLNTEDCYFTLLNKGKTPQEAREILPNATKTELVMTGFESDWKQFFKLRCSSAAHPMMQDLANKIKGLIYG